MIPRYSRPQMQAIWSEENKFSIFMQIEIYACQAMANHGFIPAHVAEIIEKFASFEVERTQEIEKETRHDVIAFITNLCENIVKKAEEDNYKLYNKDQINDAIRYIHYGMTSSDVLDTTFSYQLKESSNMIIDEIRNVLNKLKEIAIKYKYQKTIGRSHSVHAEPISFGQKMLGFYCEFERNLERFETAKNEISTCMISGPVGNFSSTSMAIEKHVGKKMGLYPEICSTQVIPRDRYAQFFCTIGIIASSIEHLAIEIRHLQRTEVLEVEEGFKKGQKGSSAMPHKKNPILSENLTGLARMLRSYAIPAMENVALWHERDISHSSVERIIGPDACILLDFALSRLFELLDNLVINTDNMEKNIYILGNIYLSHISLLALTRLGLARDEAYKIIQRNAMIAWKERNLNFLEALKNDQELLGIIKNSNTTTEKFFNEIENHNYLKYVDAVFNQVLK
jgi:adenylosuccinate lyase